MTSTQPSAAGSGGPGAESVGPGAGPPSSVFLGALVLLSSAVVLVSEIVATRVIAPYVGITLETISAVIGVILAGISLGSWLGGVLADRWPVRAVLVPALAIGGALLIASPYVVRELGPGRTASNPTSALVLTIAGFLLPSIALSAVPPTVLKTLAQGAPRLGSIAGAMSAIATAGALLGNFGAGFVLVGTLRSGQILVVCGSACLVLAAITAFVLRDRTTSRAGIVPVVLVIGGLAAGAGLDARLPCGTETKYVCLNIDELQPDVFLVQSNIYNSSRTNVADPNDLGLHYARDVAAVVAAHEGRSPGAGTGGGPPAFGYVGGGGYTLPLFFEAAYPGSSHLVYEIDADLVREVVEAFGIDDLAERFPARIGDARVEMADAVPGSFDYVIGDAFAGISVPWHLTTVEFLEDVKASLGPDGLYIMNLIDYDNHDLARAQARTIEAVFGEVVVIAPENVFSASDGIGENIILVGGASLPDEPALRPELRRLDSRSAVAGGRNAIDAFVGDATLLTDDFAPVDQLIGRP